VPEANTLYFLIGEVVPAREGLRHTTLVALIIKTSFIGEVVPAREGLRLLCPYKE